MEKIEYVIKFMRNIVWGLVLQGLLVIVVGVLIFMYPDLLGMLVGIVLISGGVLSFALALKVNKYSKIKIEF